MEGECNCGAIKVKVTDPELYTKRRGHICHCLNCRKTASSAYGLNLVIEKSKVQIEGAENLTTYEDPKTLTGNIVRRSFCKTCGNPITSETDAVVKAGNTILKLGIFDNPPQPEMESFCDDRIPWLSPHDGTVRYKVARGGEKDE